MSKNICEVCGTENEPQYVYCKNCGGALKAEENQETNNSKAEDFKRGEEVHNEPNFNGSFSSFVNDYDGVSSEELGLFVGKNGDKILPKFAKLHASNSKVSWCWPPAVLGFLFGAMGSALWFFYRKMYKTAVIFALVGAVITVVTGALSFSDTEAISDSVIESFAAGDFEGAMDKIEKSEEETPLSQKIMNTVATFVSDISDIIAGLIAGVFGLYFYKKYCIEKITEYRKIIPDSTFYKMGLSSVGGTSGGMLAVGIILIFAVGTVVSFITAFINFVV